MIAVSRCDIALSFHVWAGVVSQRAPSLFCGVEQPSDGTNQGPWDLMVNDAPQGLDAIKNQTWNRVVGSPISVDDPELSLPQRFRAAVLQRRAPPGPDRAAAPNPHPFSH